MLKCISRNCGWLFFWEGCLHRRCIYIHHIKKNVFMNCEQVESMTEFRCFKITNYTLLLSGHTICLKTFGLLEP